MKKIGILIIILTCAIGVHAQEISFGVKAGANFAQQIVINSGLSDLPGPLTSFHGGVYMQAKFGRFGIQPELLYSRQGGTYNYPVINFTGSVKTDYFLIPVLITYAISDHVTLQLGPQLSVLNSAKGTLNGVTTDARYQYKTGDFGVAGGFTIALSNALVVGGRYVYGTRDINSGNVGFWNSSKTNGVAQVFVGYALFKNYRIQVVRK